MGSNTIRNIISKLDDDIEFINRERLSKLSYAGHKKISRIDRKTAISAFSAEEVYAIAELIRRQKGGAAIVMNSKGTIKLITGKRTDVAGSGTLDINTQGSNQLHNGRTNIQYNEGGTEGKGEALNILCYGDYVEQSMGSTRYIRAQKILIEATEELVLEGQNVSIQAQGDLQMSASSFTTAQVNKKDIIIGQNMKFGASQE